MRRGVIVALAMTLAACGSTAGGGAPLPSRSLGAPAPLPVPSSYAQACALEASVCTTASTQQVDAALLVDATDVPSVAAGAPCPASRGTPLSTSSFGGIVFGSGPVHALLSAGGDPAMTARIESGQVQLVTTGGDGWRGFKTLWFTDRGYGGVFVVSARRLDGVGAVAFGEQPAVGRLVVPAGATVNVGADGEREAPGGSWVTAPGCYGWEVRTSDHTETIVLDVEG